MRKKGQSPTNNMGGKFSRHDLWGETKPHKDFHTIWRDYLYVHCMCKALTTHGGVMKRKEVNFTIRLSADLKRDAEMAATLMDVTLSQVVRQALRKLVTQAQSQQVNLDYIAQQRRDNLEEIEQWNEGLNARGVPPLLQLKMNDVALQSISSMQSAGMITPEKAKHMRLKAKEDFADE